MTRNCTGNARGIVRIGRLADVIEGADVRMCERRDRSRLPLEPPTELRICSDLCRQDFDRDGSVQPNVA
jgi:hypothetical protein